MRSSARTRPDTPGQNALLSGPDTPGQRPDKHVLSGPSGWWVLVVVGRTGAL